MQKHWIVEDQYDNAGSHLFYVYGNGIIHSTANFIIPIPVNKTTRDNLEPIYGEDALSAILGINGYYYTLDSQTTPEDIENNEHVNEEAVEGMIADIGKRSLGISADDLAEVLPDAVRTDPEARLCIDYNAVVTMLVEAVKQQQAEIESLRQTLEENGLLRK